MSEAAASRAETLLPAQSRNSEISVADRPGRTADRPPQRRRNVRHAPERDAGGAPAARALRRRSKPGWSKIRFARRSARPSAKYSRSSGWRSRDPWDEPLATVVESKRARFTA